MPNGKQIWLVAIWLAVMLSGCGQSAEAPAVVHRGATRGEVRTQLGEPALTQEFSLPEAPFFGPQEMLVDLLPAGTLIEEWVYVIDEDELFVWFAGEADQPRDQWRVVETARHPAGAVY